jgi:fatty acid desaturase
MSEAFEPLQEVRKSFKVSWYRCPIEPAVLKDHTSRSNLQGFLQAIGHLAIIALAAFFTCYFFGRGIWVGFAISLFVFGTVYSFTNHACHELSHGTVFRTKWLNGFFLRVYALLGWFNFHYYKASHTYHHLYTLHPRGDLEVVLPKYPSLEFPYLLQLFTLSITGGWESPGLVSVLRVVFKLAFLRKVDAEWSLAVFAGEDQRAAFDAAVAWARVLVIFNVVVLAAGVLSGLWLLALMIVFGSFLGNWLRYFVGVPMHVGLRDNVPDFRLCVRTITLDPISHFLYWRMNYHTEHHMYAAVPCYKLRKLHKTLAPDMPAARTLVGAWREMRETWRRQQKEPGYQFDTPLPRLPAAGTKPQDPLASSLGDLKPKSLE